MNRTTHNPWLSAYAALTTVATLCLIGVGGLVTSHGAGLAVPDWPTSYGYNMFFFPISRWVGGIFYEHTHRLVASTVGFMTIILALWLWRKEARAWLRWLGIFALVAVVIQGVLGGLRVTLTMDGLGIFHAILAQLFLACVGAIALFTSPWWVNRTEAPNSARTLLRPWYIGLAVIILMQLALGATMRHQHAGLAVPDFPAAYGKLWPGVDANSIQRYNEMRAGKSTARPITAFQVKLQMAHRVCALGILILAGMAGLKTVKKLGWRTGLGKTMLALATLIVAQVLLGAATIWTNKSADIATAHVTVGALSFLLSVLLILTASDNPVAARAFVSAPDSVKPKPTPYPSPA